MLVCVLRVIPFARGPRGLAGCPCPHGTTASRTNPAFLKLIQQYHTAFPSRSRVFLLLREDSRLRAEVRAELNARSPSRWRARATCDHTTGMGSFARQCWATIVYTTTANKHGDQEQGNASHALQPVGRRLAQNGVEPATSSADALRGVHPRRHSTAQGMPQRNSVLDRRRAVKKSDCETSNEVFERYNPRHHI
jgi:hypothetical protein